MDVLTIGTDDAGELAAPSPLGDSTGAVVGDPPAGGPPAVAVGSIEYGSAAEEFEDGRPVPWPADAEAHPDLYERCHSPFCWRWAGVARVSEEQARRMICVSCMLMIGSFEKNDIDRIGNW